MNKKSKLSRFLSKDITLMVISVLLALVIWFIINAGSDAEGSIPINDIPIKIELSDEAKKDGLQVFGDDKLTASVEVQGNKLIVGSLTASDIEIVPLDINSVDSPGYHKLKLKANKLGIRSNYSMSNPDPEHIVIYVDRYKKRSFTIVDEIVYKVDQNYYKNSSMSESTVTVEGPETEVNSIDKVVVRGELEGTTDKTTSDNFDLVFLDKNGETLDIKISKSSVDSVVVTMKPLPIKEVTLGVDIVNGPAGFKDYTITPATINIAAEASILDSFEDGILNVGVVDFSILDNSNRVLEYDITLPNGCKNLSNSTTAEVTVDLSDYGSKTITVDNFKTTNIDLKKYNVKFNTGSFDVIVFGPKDIIDDITTKDVIPTVDFSNTLDDVTESSLSTELTFDFSFTKDFKGCWVYGEHKAVVNISAK